MKSPNRSTVIRLTEVRGRDCYELQVWGRDFDFRPGVLVTYVFSCALRRVCRAPPNVLISIVRSHFGSSLVADR